MFLQMPLPGICIILFGAFIEPYQSVQVQGNVMKVIARNIWSRPVNHVTLASRLSGPKYEKTTSRTLRIMGEGGSRNLIID